MKHPLPHIGFRMLKTALSVSICLLLARLFAYPPPVYACIAAVIVTKETVESSLKMGIARVSATLVGGVMALVWLFFDLQRVPYLEIPLIGIGILVTLYFCLIIKEPDAAALACVVFLIITLQHPYDKHMFALVRVCETIAGICISLVVNRLIRPPKGKEKQTVEK